MTISEFKEYYSNLLIVQFKNKDNAKEMIEATVELIALTDLLKDIEDGFDLETAVGPQLTVLGKYLDFERKTFALTDDDYRFYLKFKRILIFSNHSMKELDDAFWNNFGNEIILYDYMNAHMAYIFHDADITKINFLLDNGLLAKPAGVKLITIGAAVFGKAFVFEGNPNGLGWSHLLFPSRTIDYGDGEKKLIVDYGDGEKQMRVNFGSGEYENSQTGGQYSYLIY
jgi:hypothetical protein